MFEGSAYLMFGLAGGAYLSVGAYSRKYGIPQFSWGYIRSPDAFRPIAREIHKWRSFDRALFRSKARRKRLEHERSVGRNTRLHLIVFPTS